MIQHAPPCAVTASCPVSPSEDPDKVKTAVANVLPGSDISYRNYSVSASGKLGALEKIRESMVSRQSRGAYRRTLEKNAGPDSAWFYLNKQAAFAKKVAICAEPDESPLGPIRVALESPNIGRVIDLVTGGSKIS